MSVNASSHTFTLNDSISSYSYWYDRLNTSYLHDGMRWIAWMRSLCGIPRGKDWAQILINWLHRNTERSTMGSVAEMAWVPRNMALNGNLDQIFWREQKPQKNAIQEAVFDKLTVGGPFTCLGHLSPEPIDIGEFPHSTNSPLMTFATGYCNAWEGGDIISGNSSVTNHVACQLQHLHSPLTTRQWKAIKGTSTMGRVAFLSGLSSRSVCRMKHTFQYGIKIESKLVTLSTTTLQSLIFETKISKLAQFNFDC